MTRKLPSPGATVQTWYVTQERAVDEATASRFWEVYENSFGRMRMMAAARQLLTEEEFHHEVSDERVIKLVARDATGTAWAMATLTDDLRTVPWIEPAFYHRLYPEAAARNALFYNGFVCVHPDAQGSPCFRMIMSEIVKTVVAVEGVLCTDICRYNVEEIGFIDGVVRHTSAFADITPKLIDVQNYYSFALSAKS